MKIDNNTVVTLAYRLRDRATGQLIEETSADHPMEFIYGIERVLPKFEEAIHGLEAGNNFAVEIPAAEAYGVSADEARVRIPKHVFHDENGAFDDERFTPGSMVPMSDNEGNHHHGRILEVGDEDIHMDFNHPLADTDLAFEGEIIAVRKATDEELAHGHSHGEHGHHHH